MAKRKKTLKQAEATLKIEVEELSDSELSEGRELLPGNGGEEGTPVFQKIGAPESAETDPRNPNNQGPE